MDGESHSQSRRRFLKTSGLVTGLTATALTAPWVRKAGAADTIIWKIQTSWPAGVGLETFQSWCGTIKEKTGGQLEFQPFKGVMENPTVGYVTPDMYQGLSINL
ncbi:substrate-binding domain-containing protein [Mesorhizobium sp. M0701]|uniref:substrate-binding domain-containing protein n=1 Tax=Mesorhizobium sp. M0701 TaxID=2956989 RepID=UPI00333A69F4